MMWESYNNNQQQHYDVGVSESPLGSRVSKFKIFLPARCEISVLFWFDSKENMVESTRPIVGFIPLYFFSFVLLQLLLLLTILEYWYWPSCPGMNWHPMKTPSPHRIRRLRPAMMSLVCVVHWGILRETLALLWLYWTPPLLCLIICGATQLIRIRSS